MRKRIFWIILAGITLIAMIILAELVATIIYLRSPDRVVSGAFLKLIDAKSLSYSIDAEDSVIAASGKLRGDMDWKSPTNPIAEASFSFRMGDAVAVSGSVLAAGGKAFVKFDEAKGIPQDFMAALKGDWVSADVVSLYLLAGENAVSLDSYLSDADVDIIIGTLKKHLPLAAAGKGEDELLGNVYVARYPIAFDKKAALAFIDELHGLLNGQDVSEAKFAAIREAISAMPDWGGDAWVGKADGMLHAMRLALPMGGAERFNLVFSFSDWNKKVESAAPSGSVAIYDLLKRVYSPTLGLGSGSSKPQMTLPEAIRPLTEIPTVESKSGAGLAPGVQANRPGGGGLIDALLRLIYGSNPFSPSGGGAGVFNVNTQK